jgi:hypothetical protein
MRTKAQLCLLFSLAPALGLVLVSCQKKASISGTSFADGAKTTATKAEKTPPQKILALKELMSTLGIQNPKRDMAAVTDNELDLLTELLLAARNKSAKERAEIVSSVKYILNAAIGVTLFL